ncbi:hypothetical protein DK389_03965 [Methylobacterium durans]|uniref:Uncharacterized protein n=1 Tax=Methylobacterium durans TaxID=2202825 RepID=A0A2U8W180_9HYPH|nr:hypothetical protein DK389_03965 [Methylobacterium durans]
MRMLCPRFPAEGERRRRMREPDAFDVLRRKQHLALRFAVREDRSVPSFVQGGIWNYGAPVRGGEATPPGFRSEAAMRATRQIRWYLLHALDG